MKLVILSLFIVLVSFCQPSLAYDQEDYEIFDLIELIGLKKNFYSDVLGIKEDATTTEIKKAFRGLSIVTHPDKNSAEDADVQFRNLVSVYETLKDAGKREKYDNVLKNGMPNWKSAAYYYRKARKVGLLEMFIMLFIILTICQYFISWAVYLEKKYTMEQLFETKAKKVRKANMDVDSILNEIPKPSIRNTLPFQIPCGIYAMITGTPSAIKESINLVADMRKKELEKKQKEKDEEENQKKMEEDRQREKEERKEGLRRRKEKQAKLPEKTAEELAAYSATIIRNPGKDAIKTKVPLNGGNWTDDDLTELTRLTKKYPGGTVDRWEVIADFMNRNVSEVTFMAYKLKDNAYQTPGESEKIIENINRELNKKIKTKSTEDNAVVEKVWSQDQQKALEAAIQKYPKRGADDRWVKIANSVPGKTKEECQARYRYLVGLVKKQKEEATKEQDKAAEEVEKEPEPIEEEIEEPKEVAISTGGKKPTLKRDVIMLQQNYVTSNNNNTKANNIERTNPIFENGFNSLSDNKERLNSNSDSGNSTKTTNSSSSSNNNLNNNNNSFYISGTQGNLKVMSSGHCSPTDDHLDSGTCSDAELNLSSPQPPPLPPKKLGHSIHHLLSDSISSDDSVCSLSSDSLSYHVSTNKHKSILSSGGSQLLSPELIKSLDTHQKTVQKDFLDAKPRPLALLPSSLLKDIRNHALKFNLNDVNYLQDRSSASSDEEVDELDDIESNYSDCNNIVLVNQSRNYEHNIKFNHMRKGVHNNNHALIEDNNNFYENDKFYKFHINEHLSNSLTDNCQSLSQDIDESFAGIKDINNGTSTIRSSKGTVRGVKNRVRNGIATFLQMQQTTVKNYKDKDAGKVVVYTTSMGIVRSTYAKCQSIKQILRTLLVKFEERDVYMSNEYQDEVKDRMLKDEIDIPQLFVNGQHIGNADKVERLNETGELRKMLKQFKCFDSVLMCKICGGYKLLPCPSCGGSKKSIHRNHFTAEFINLRCMNCDEVGLIKCYNC
ncbi:unnamed protein product [Diamesa serratosioi]